MIQRISSFSRHFQTYQNHRNYLRTEFISKHWISTSASKFALWPTFWQVITLTGFTRSICGVIHAHLRLFFNEIGIKSALSRLKHHFKHCSEGQRSIIFHRTNRMRGNRLRLRLTVNAFLRNIVQIDLVPLRVPFWRDFIVFWWINLQGSREVKCQKSYCQLTLKSSK